MPDFIALHGADPTCFRVWRTRSDVWKNNETRAEKGPKGKWNQWKGDMSWTLDSLHQWIAKSAFCWVGLAWKVLPWKSWNNVLYIYTQIISYISLIASRRVAKWWQGSNQTDALTRNQTALQSEEVNGLTKWAAKFIKIYQLIIVRLMVQKSGVHQLRLVVEIP